LRGPEIQPSFQLLSGDSEAAHARNIQMIELHQHVLLELVSVLRLDLIGQTSLNKTDDCFRWHERAHQLGHERTTQRPVSRGDLIEPDDLNARVEVQAGTPVSQQYNSANGRASLSS